MVQSRMNLVCGFLGLDGVIRLERRSPINIARAMFLSPVHLCIRKHQEEYQTKRAAFDNNLYNCSTP